jgi:hypothetical protein
MFAAAAFLPQFTIPQPGMAMPPLTGAGITMPILPFAPNTSTFATGQMNRGSQNPPISIPQPRFTQSRMHGESRSDFRPRTNQYSDGFNAPRDVGRGRGNWRNGMIKI